MKQGKIITPEVPPYILTPARVKIEQEPDPMDSRLFKTTTKREQFTLSGRWGFLIDPKDEGIHKKFYRHFPESETQLPVPGTWNVEARYYQYHGAAWYHRTFKLKRECNIHIHFGSILLSSRVWLDGKEIGRHEAGYTPVDFFIPNVKAGKHELIIRVNNRMDKDSLPKWGSDWYHYGGIPRPVYIEIVPNILIERFHVIPKWDGQGPAELCIRVFTLNLGKSRKSARLKFYIDSKLVYESQISVERDKALKEFKVMVNKPRPWSPEEPNLYVAHLMLGDDDQIDRFGIRSLKAEGCKIMLNRQRIKIKGANRHDDHPDWGAALPQTIIRRDIEILKRMNGNAFRGHYPPSKMFMDYCDEAGVLFFTEIPAWQYSAEQLKSSAIMKSMRTFLKELINRDMNHPSIFSWSLGNEWTGLEAPANVNDIYNNIKSLVEYAKELDIGGNHFISTVTGNIKVNCLTELYDVIMGNWQIYPWYDVDSPAYLDDESKKAQIGQLEKSHRAYPNKPIIITEFGGSGALYGWRNWGNVKWSENFQARSVAHSAEFVLKTDYLSGGLVWQFCDTRTHTSMILGPRLRGWNVKGVLNEYRMPKMAYLKLQETFSQY